MHSYSTSTLDVPAQMTLVNPLTSCALGLDTDDIEPTEGNQTRDLWKLACWEMAREVSPKNLSLRRGTMLCAFIAASVQHL